MTSTDPATSSPDVASVTAPDGDAGAPRPSWWRRVGRPARLALDAAVLLVVALLTLAPGIASLPVTDRDEARYVQATRQMIETGDWIDIRFQEDPRYKKPVGIYWMQAAAIRAAGYGPDAPIWIYRLPSLIGAIAAVLLTYAIGVALAGPGAGLAAGLLAAGTITLGLEARIAKTDAMLLATVLAAEWALASLWMDPERRVRFGRNAAFWTALGIGVLVKGPVILLVVGTTLAVLMAIERSWRLLRALQPLRGFAWTLLLVLPWLVAIGWISNGEFFTASLGEDMLAKVGTGQESHGAPPGMHALVALGTFWPLSAFVPAAIAWAISARATRPVQFLAAWIVPGWAVFEAIATKLPNYVLPFMPGFAVMTGLALAAGGFQAATGWRRVTLAFLAFAGVVLAIGLNAAFVVIEGRASILGLAGGVVGGALAILAWRLAAAGRTWPGVAAAVAASAAITATAFAVLLPGAGQLWLSDRLRETIQAVKTCPEPQVISVGYREPSMVFVNGTHTLLAQPDEAAVRFAAADCAVLVVDGRQSGEVIAALAARDVRPVATTSIQGRNFNGLRLRTMDVYVKP
jgi:4-amino-4-deoxy-L-arabinose transferase-like glycosyltransferase